MMVLEKDINATNDGYIYLEKPLIRLLLLLSVHVVAVFVGVFLLGITTLTFIMLLIVFFLGYVP